MASSRINVIIPILNRASFISVLLSNMAKQILLPDRIIIVDDGSSEPINDAIHEWQNTNQTLFDIEYVRHPETLGVSQARNSGIQLLERENCEYVYFLDSDDAPAPEFLEATHAAMESNPETVAVTTSRIIISDAKEEHIDQSQIEKNPWEWFLTHGAGIASCTLLRTDTVLEVGGFNTTLETAEDTEFFCQIANKGKWAHIDFPVVRYLQKSNLAHLRNKHRDHLRRWALCFENCIENFGIRENVKTSTIRREMSKRWRYAGEQLFAQGRYEESEECIRRSLAWHFFKNLSWAHLLIHLSIKKKK